MYPREYSQVLPPTGVPVELKCTPGTCSATSANELRFCCSMRSRVITVSDCGVSRNERLSPTAAVTGPGVVSDPVPSVTPASSVPTTLTFRIVCSVAAVGGGTTRNT
jgi:hypothetical protein